jgi:hypothetical protein
VSFNEGRIGRDVGDPWCSTTTVRAPWNGGGGSCCPVRCLAASWAPWAELGGKAKWAGGLEKKRL